MPNGSKRTCCNPPQKKPKTKIKTTQAERPQQGRLALHCALNDQQNEMTVRQAPHSSPPKTEPAAKWQVEHFQVPSLPNQQRFHDFHLAPTLMRGIQERGFSYCTPIQAQILQHSLQGRDAIGQAQTGTGKTAAFLITLITQLLEVPPPQERYMGEPRALIIAPTRELVMQIAQDAKALAKYTGLNVMQFVGGMPFNQQLQALEARYCDILVATPGRLLDFHQRSDIHLDMVEVLVLDEADRMLDMGFIPQVRQIIRQTPPKRERQTLLFSATFSDDVLHLTQQWTQDPVQVAIEPKQVTNTRITQRFYTLANEEKCPLLCNLLQQHPEWDKVMVFANRKDEVRQVEGFLTRHGISAAQMSGDIPQARRAAVLDNFRGGGLRVLVATDVAGRGIHIDDVGQVINYNLPETPDDYVHRIGRTGRAGQLGVSISFIGEDDAFALPAIEALLGHPLPCERPATALLEQPR